MNAAGVTRRRFGQLVGGFFAALGIGSEPARALLRSRVVEVEVDGDWRELPGVVWSEDARAWIEHYRGLYPRAVAIDYQAKWIGDDFVNGREPVVLAKLVDLAGNDAGSYLFRRRSAMWRDCPPLRHVRLEAGDRGRVPLVDAGRLREEVARVFEVPVRMVPDSVSAFYDRGPRL